MHFDYFDLKQKYCSCANVFLEQSGARARCKMRATVAVKSLAVENEVMLDAIVLLQGEKHRIQHNLRLTLREPI